MVNCIPYKNSRVCNTRCFLHLLKFCVGSLCLTRLDGWPFGGQKSRVDAGAAYMLILTYLSRNFGMDLTPYSASAEQVVKASSGHFPLPVLDKQIKN